LISSVGDAVEPSLFIRGRVGGAAQPHGSVEVLKMKDFVVLNWNISFISDFGTLGYIALVRL